MSVEIIRVQEPTAIGWGEWLWKGAKQQAKDRPYLALPIVGAGGVVAAPFIATGAATIAAGVAVGAVATGVSELVWGPDTTPPVTYLSVDAAREITDIHGQALMRGVTYMRHPRPTQDSSIIKSTDFHGHIMSQKVAEIIHYMRAETRLKSLSILIRSSDSKHAVVGGELEKVPVKMKADLSRQNERRMTLTYDERGRPAHLVKYVWLNDFPEVVAATRHARNGTMNFSQSTDMSFGMSGSVAKTANFKAGWLSTFVIEIEATFS